MESVVKWNRITLSTKIVRHCDNKRNLCIRQVLNKFFLFYWVNYDDFNSLLETTLNSKINCTVEKKDYTNQFSFCVDSTYVRIRHLQ